MFIFASLCPLLQWTAGGLFADRRSSALQMAWFDAGYGTTFHSHAGAGVDSDMCSSFSTFLWIFLI